MFLYLVQHGIPKPKSEDPSQSLSDIGKAEIEAVAKVASSLNLKISKIFHSNKLRAIQTAEILEKYLKPEEGREEAEGLKPLDDIKIWIEKIKELNKPIMLVGHLPHLAKLSSFLITGDEEKLVINFRQGAIVCLEKKENNWIINWILHPDFCKI
ncbi:phosphohistidine phosphatase SixA [Candidatus Pacearchaeota archaeon]|nr:MAG: phosphohistidine phosphatase SixA [Candidatus Pacearchaeota archaeon]